MSEITAILLQSAEDSFLEVGVFVGALLLFFGLLNYRTAGAVVDLISRQKRLQVLIGAAFGMSPGCGGAIFVMPLYVRGVVTFGTVSSFVIIARMPKQALYIHLISFVVGVISGYIVDALGIGSSLVRPAEAPPAAEENATEPDSESPYPHIGHQAGDAVSRALHPPNREVRGSLGYEITHRGWPVYWATATLGLIVGFLLLGQLDVNQWVGFNLTRVVGLSGAVISVIWLVAGRHTIIDDTHAEAEEKAASLTETLVHNAHETAFVTFWVFVAYSLYAILMHVTHLDLQLLVEHSGVWPIIACACIGLIPGCGPQIVTVTLYIQGVIPFSALVAHTISQDGDALFPMIAMHPRAALLATITTTVPAILLGVLLYWAGL
jgi:hypothetical protein